MITRVDCACTLHMLEVEVMDDGVVFLSSWRLATPRHEYGTLRQRVAEAWRVLRGWDAAGDEYVLDRDGARKLAAALSTLAASDEDSGGSEHWLRGAGFGGMDDE